MLTRCGYRSLVIVYLSRVGYIQEWLDCMTIGGYLEKTPRNGPHKLPAEHAAALVDYDSAFYEIPFLSFIPALAGALPKIESAFRSGEGNRSMLRNAMRRCRAWEAGYISTGILLSRCLWPRITTWLPLLAVYT